MKMLPVGSPAVGKDFINREDEIKIILNSLEKDSVLLIAPRRYGKTSIMKRIEAILGEEKGDEIPVIFIDIHDVYNPQEFLIELATGAFDMARNKKSFIEKLKNSFSGILGDMEEFEISLGELKVLFKRSLKEKIEKGGWKEEGRNIFTFIRNYFDDTAYFIIDEFSECVHNMSKENKEEAEMFLKWFRKVRMKESNLKFILGGSVSIDRVVRIVTALSAINDFKRITINGFPRKTALYAVEKVFDEEGWKYTESIGGKIVECIGVPSVPYFLSVFLSIIQEEFLEKDLDEKYIEDMYNSKLMGASGKHYFDYYVQRLAIYYEEKEKRVAKEILKRLCQTSQISKEIAFDVFKKITNKDDYEWFTDLISDLENDFYLKQERNRILFYSKPLADWWRLYHV
jgi:hypothetical protein